MSRRMNWDRANRENRARDQGRRDSREEFKLPFESYGAKRLCGFLGSRGFPTHLILTERKLVAIAAAVFELPEMPDPAAMAERINGLSKNERRRRAEKNVGPIAADLMGVQPAPGTTSGLESEQPASQEDAEATLHELVMALLNTGNGHLLALCPQVQKRYRAHAPTVKEFANQIGLVEAEGSTIDGSVVRYSILTKDASPGVMDADLQPPWSAGATT